MRQNQLKYETQDVVCNLTQLATKRNTVFGYFNNFIK